MEDGSKDRQMVTLKQSKTLLPKLQTLRTQILQPIISVQPGTIIPLDAIILKLKVQISNNSLPNIEPIDGK